MDNLLARLDTLVDITPGVTAIADADLFKDAAERIRFLEETVRQAIYLVEGLRVFGNDNIHRYDVPPWLNKARAAVSAEAPLKQP